MHIRNNLSRLLLALIVPAALVWAGCDNGIELDESGELLVEDLQIGTGEAARDSMRLVVHATGSILGGAQFSDSRDRERPLVFQLGVGEVIEGWDLGLGGLREGGIRRLTIPPRLAFGTQKLRDVPPNSTVVFDIELLRVDHPDSLTIEEMREGTGPVVEAGDTLTVHYVGYFGSGQTFDTSVNGNPYPFIVGVGWVIQGWDIGLLGMREGGLRRLIVPPRLAYANRTDIPGIPPGSTLIFEVNLLDVRK